MSNENMTKQEKLNWIVDYILSHGWRDVYMEDFVESYIKMCKPKNYQPTFWRGFKVPELNRYLAELYKIGVLDRFDVRHWLHTFNVFIVNYR